MFKITLDQRNIFFNSVELNYTSHEGNNHQQASSEGIMVKEINNE